jgi:hypothetical protein
MSGSGKIAVIAALFLASCGGDDEPAAGTPTPTSTATPTATAAPDYSSEYPNAVRRQFMRGCVEDDPRSYCRCLMDYVAQRVPYATFSRLADDKVPRAVEKAIDDGIEECS